MSDATPSLDVVRSYRSARSKFRLAMVPGQPILIGLGGDERVTALVRPETTDGVYENIATALDELIGEHDLFGTPMASPSKRSRTRR